MAKCVEINTVNNGREEILKISSRLMAKKGYAGTSMRELAKATDRSLAGLYHYFVSKEELLFHINYQGFVSLKESSSAIFESGESPESQLFAFIKNHISYFSAHLDEMRVMMLGTQQLDSSHGKKIEDAKKEYGDIGHKIVAQYLKHSSEIKLNKKDISRKVFLLFGMMNWIYGWYSPLKHGSEAALIDDIFNTFTRGVVAQ